MHNIGIFAGDMRQRYICTFLGKAGYDPTYLYNFQESKTYVIPVPFTKDNITVNAAFKEPLLINDFLGSIKEGDILFGGNIPKQSIELLSNKNVTFYDFLKDDEIVWDNAYLTAEGLLSQIISSTPFSLKSKKILIIGYGRCGSLIAKLISPLCNTVYIYDHTPKHLYELKTNGFTPLKHDEIIYYMKDFDVIINTVPSKELNESHYNAAKKSCHFYEIASKPFGLDNDIISKHNLNLITCPGIPGKTSPETAGEIISKYIIRHLRKG